jgi:uncharacterized protein (TIGR03083 family)
VDYTRRLADSAAAAGPDASVPTTPGWTIKDLVEHVGQTQHWVAEIIERRINDPMQLPTEMAVLPTDSGQWQAWLSTAAQRVANACSDEALDAPVFNASGDARSGTRFWMSSVLNETVVHGADAASAANRTTEIEADIAAALISNHLAMLTSPTWEMYRSESAHALRGTGLTMLVLATDAVDDVGAWFVERRPDGATWKRGTQAADATLTGPAGSLLLALTRRLPLTDRDVSVGGDAAIVVHWLDNTAHVSD